MFQELWSCKFKDVPKCNTTNSNYIYKRKKENWTVPFRTQPGPLKKQVGILSIIEMPKIRRRML